MNETLKEKYEKLKNFIASLESVAVAYSGGVDSTFLLKTAHDVLGNNATAVTVRSALIPGRELGEGEKFCAENKITQIFCPVDIFKVEGLKENPENRCYICKKNIFTKILEIARERGIKNVIEGSNVDDLSDYRPGLKALKELEIKSPLQAAGLTKKEIRELSKSFNLPTWNKPSFACLASRFEYGEEITEEKLKMTDRAEDLLVKMNFRQFRVRLHGKIARIEILPEDFEKIIQEQTREKIYSELKNLGFSYVTLDLKGYRTGSMNENMVNTFNF